MDIKLCYLNELFQHLSPSEQEHVISVIVSILSER